jgi:hypothetical protein
MKVKFPSNTSKWQMEFNSEFKGLIFCNDRAKVGTGRICSTRNGESITILITKSKCKRLFVINSIKINIKETERKYINRFHLAQDSGLWLLLVETG